MSEPVKFDADTCMSGLREMVDARVKGEFTDYSRHETTVREQLAALQGEIAELRRLAKKRDPFNVRMG
mgnify:CR=1 FL=1